MLATTFSLLRRNPIIYLLLIAICLTLHWLIEQGHIPEWTGYLLAIPNLLLGFFVHRAVLFKEQFLLVELAKKSTLLKAVEFAGKSVGISLLSFGMIFLGVFAAYVASGFAAPDGIALAIWTFVTLAAFPVLFAFVGTWLPASIYGQASSFGEAIRRGRSTFLSLLAKLLVPFALNAVAPYLVTIEFLYNLGTVPTISGSDLFDTIGFAAIAFQYAVRLISITMAAVALSLTYIRAEGLELTSA